MTRSLKRLEREQVDLYQIHSPGGRIKIEDLMDAMADAVEAGKTRYVGVSNYSAGEMRRAYARLAKRGIPLVLEYSLIHRSPAADGMLDACTELNVTLIAYSPLGRGVLSGKYRSGASVRTSGGFTASSGAINSRRSCPLSRCSRRLGWHTASRLHRWPSTG